MKEIITVQCFKKNYEVFSKKNRKVENSLSRFSFFQGDINANLHPVLKEEPNKFVDNF